MINFLKNWKLKLKTSVDSGTELLNGDLKEKAKAVLMARDLYEIATKNGVETGDRASFQKDVSEIILNGGQEARESIQHQITFLDNQYYATALYERKKTELDAMADSYYEVAEKMMKDMTNDEKNKFIKSLKDFKNVDVISEMPGSLKEKATLIKRSNPMIKQESLLDEIIPLAQKNDIALNNINAYKNSLDPVKLSRNWNEKQKSFMQSGGDAINKKDFFAINSAGEIVDFGSSSSAEAIKAEHDVYNKLEKEFRNQDEARIMSPTTPLQKEFKENYLEAKENGYQLISFNKNNDNTLLMHNDNEVIAGTFVGGRWYLLGTPKNGGTKTIKSSLPGEELQDIIEELRESTINDVFGKVSQKIEKASGQKMEEVIPLSEEEVKQVEAEIETASSQPANSATGGSETNANPQTSSASGTAQTGQGAPETNEFYRLRGLDGLPDRLYDAKTNELIPNDEAFKAKARKEIDVPETVKTIYRDGEKIYDARTGLIIPGEKELLENYKGAIEVPRPKTDEEYLSEVRAEIGGERADDQPEYSEEELKGLAEEYKAGKFKDAREAILSIKKKSGEAQVEQNPQMKRKFVQILKNEDGSIKKDEAGKPVTKEFYMPIYTEEELSKLGDEDKSKILEETKAEYLKNGGTEEEWAASEEFKAYQDVMVNAASKDEITRAADLGFKAKKIKESGAEVDYKNNQGEVDSNVSEDVNVFAKKNEELGEEEDDEKEDEEDDKETENPWANNSPVKEEKKELVTLYQPENKNIGEKRMSYRKSIKKGTLGGAE